MDLLSIKKEIIHEVNRGGCSCILILKHLGEGAEARYQNDLLKRFPEAKLTETTITTYIRDRKFYNWHYPRYYDLAAKVRTRLINQFFKREFNI